MLRTLGTLATLLILGSSSSFANTPSKNNTPHNTQTSIKIGTKKIEMIFVSQEGCRSCKKIKAYMEEREIKQLLSEHFILSMKDLSESRSLPNNLQQPLGTPTIYFIDEDGEELIEAMVGGKSEKNFIKTLQDAISANQKKR